MSGFCELYEKWQSPVLADEESVSLARRLARLYPRKVESWWALGSSLYGVVMYPGRTHGRDASLSAGADFLEMVHAFRMVLQLDPTETGAAWNLAISLEAAGELSEAAECYEAVAAIESAERTDEQFADPVVSLLLAARCRAEMGDYTLAMADYEKACDLAQDVDDKSDELWTEVRLRLSMNRLE